MDNNLYNKAYAFAIRIIKGYQFLSKEKREFILSKQLLKSGTSIGANIAEANGAISNADFSSKISIAYKESLETKYWLSLLRDTDFINSKTFKSMFKDADELSRILYSILKTTRIKGS
ncbi:MAG: four helix bundle protein [Balneolaceae bacterium]|nr:four helix bundle protein [Balneolaceae bacterium]